MRRYVIGLLAAALAGCAEEAPPPTVASAEPVSGVSWGEAPEVEPVEAQVFGRTPVTEAGPGRVLLHVLVQAGATEEQIRRTLMDVLTRAAEEDTTVVALRAIVYVLPKEHSGDVELAPTAWGEWLPPQGWEGATPESRREFHRIYTYFGVAPPW